MGRRILNSLVVGEMAAAVTLVVGAGLLVKSFQRLSDAELGFQPHRLLAVEVFLSDLDYPEHHQRVAFVEEVLAGVRSLPGVRSAGVSTNIPLSIATWDASYTVEGKPPVDTSEVPITAHRVVTPGYLETLGVSLVGGRLINSDDREGSLSAVVISEEFARRAWPGEDPLGKRVKPGYPAAESTPWYTVVGVVKDVKEDRFNFRIDRPVWYMSYLQRQTSLPIYLLVRSEGDPLRLVDSIRNIIWAANKNQPISNVTTVEAHLDEFLGPQRFGALLSGMFAVLGLVLAAVGLYGVMSYSVNQRTQEFGIRMALGAKGGDLIRLVIRWGLLLTAIGLGVGLLGSAVLARVLTSLLYQVRPGDPSTFVTATLILLLVGLVAAYFPASRTARLDPNIALRYE